MKRLSRIIIASAGLLLMGAPIKALAVDASFQPQASITYSCQTADKDQRKIAKFENNAPPGTTIHLMIGHESEGGVSFDNEVSVGDIVYGPPRLFWNIQDVYLGPWEVTDIKLDSSCQPGGAADAAPASNWLAYGLPIGAAALLIGFMGARYFVKRQTK